jgi:hypothetical protein
MRKSQTLGKLPKPAELSSSGTFPGFYRATVLVRKDTDKQHRIKVNCPAIWGKISEDKLPWCYPVMPAWAGNAQFGGGGFAAVPPLKAPVLICFEGGNPKYPLYMGGWWGKKGAPCVTPNHAHSLEGEADNHYFTTPRGTSVQLDDRKSKEGKASNNEKILLRLPEGDYIVISIEGTIQGKAERNIDLRAPIRIEIQSDQRIEIKASNVSIYAQNEVFVQGGKNVHVRGGEKVSIDASQVLLNSGGALPVDGPGQTISTQSQQNGK